MLNVFWMKKKIKKILTLKQCRNCEYEANKSHRFSHTAKDSVIVFYNVIILTPTQWSVKNIVFI